MFTIRWSLVHIVVEIFKFHVGTELEMVVIIKIWQRLWVVTLDEILTLLFNGLFSVRNLFFLQWSISQCNLQETFGMSWLIS